MTDSRVSKPLIVNLAATGMVATRRQSPHVPLCVEEIVADVCRCIDLGVSMVHLHARGNDARPTSDREIFGKIIAGIRGVTAETAILFGRLTNTSPQLWLQLQSDYDLWRELQKMKGVKVEAIA